MKDSMKDSIKFGPEWLRNTVAPTIESNPATTAPATRYALAEFRYGREEMLALFDKTSKLPEHYASKYKKLFVDKIQCPLALTPSTEDDVEYSSGGGRSSWSTRPPMTGIASGGGGRGRGGSVDRGRGRGRGSFYSSTGYVRSTSLYDEEGGRGRGSDRGWIERNGGTSGTEPGGTASSSSTTEWSGAGSGITTSPRKEYGRGGVESWRRSRTDDDSSTGAVNDWRSSGFSSRDKWATRNWRDEEGGSGGTAAEYPPPHGISRSYSNPAGSNGIERKSYAGASAGKKKMWDHDDSLPEWATEDPSDYGGSFDATGAFHDSEDDDPRGKPHGYAKRLKSPRIGGGKQRGGNGGGGGGTRPGSSVSEKMEPSEEEKSSSPRSVDEKKQGRRDSSEDGDSCSSSSVSGSDNKRTPVSQTLVAQGSPSRSSPAKSQDHHPSSVAANHESPDDHIRHMRELPPMEPTPTSDHSPQQQQQQQHQQQQILRAQMMDLRTRLVSSDSSVDRMQEVATDMVAQLMAEDDVGVLDAQDHAHGHHPHHHHHHHANNTNNNVSAAGLLAQHQQRQQQQQQNVPSTVDGNVALGGKLSSGRQEMWYYQDPHQKVQGPFTAQEMAEWYLAGYFDETLLVRRNCDSRFSALGDLIKICGGTVPFMASHLIPPMLVSQPVDLPPAVAAAAASSATTHPILNVLAAAAAAQHQAAPQQVATPVDDIQLQYQLHLLQQQFMLKQQHIVMQKLSTAEQWPLLTPEQQALMLNHHMSQIQMPENLQSVTQMQNLTAQQMALLQQEGVPFGAQAKMQQPTMMQQQQQQNHHTVPSSLQQHQSIGKSFIQQQQHQQQMRRAMQSSPLGGASATVPTPGGGGGANNGTNIAQLMHQMSLSHLIAPQQQQQQPPNVPKVPNQQQQQQPPQPHENDPIKSLIYQLQSMQQGKQQQQMPPPQSQSSQLPKMESMMGAGTGGGGVGMWNSSNVNANQSASLQQLLQVGSGGSGAFGSGGQPQRMDDNIEMMRKQHQQQQQQEVGGWKHPSAVAPVPVSSTNASTNPLLSMWEMPQMKGPGGGGTGNMGPMGLNFDKTDDILDDSMQELRSHDELVNDKERELRAEAKMEIEEIKSHKQHQEHPPKEKKQSKQQQRDDEREHQQSKSGKKQQQQQQKDESNNKKGNNQQANQNKKEDEKRREAAEKQRVKEKEKKRQQQEEEKRKQVAEEARRKVIADEKKRAEEIHEQQRKSKILETQRRETVKIQEQQLQQQQQHHHQQSRQPTTMAPWSTAAVPTGPTLAEIEKLERQQRAEQMRHEQALREQQEAQQLLLLQHQKDSMLKWNASVKPQAVKSFSEIQAEEHAKQTAAEREMAERQAAKQREKKKEQEALTGASYWNAALQGTTGGQGGQGSGGGSVWNAQKIVWGGAAAASAATSNATSGGGFWEEPTAKSSSGQKMSSSNSTAKTLAKSQTMGSITTNKMSMEKQQLQSKATNKSTSNVSASASNAKKSSHKNHGKYENNIGDEFTGWCKKALDKWKEEVDIPTFVSFLQDIEAPYEVKEYTKAYLGEGKESIDFSKQFLERRSKLKSQQRANNAHIDDMCSPAPALTPNDFQEVKNKNKKVKKSKMTKVDNRILGFSVTAAPEHWNLEKNLDNSS